MKVPLKVILVGVDKILAVAQLIDGAATLIGKLFKGKPKPRHGDLVTPRVDRGAKTVVLKRRPPVPPR